MTDGHVVVGDGGHFEDAAGLGGVRVDDELESTTPGAADDLAERAEDGRGQVGAGALGQVARQGVAHEERIAVHLALVQEIPGIALHLRDGLELAHDLRVGDVGEGLVQEAVVLTDHLLHLDELGVGDGAAGGVDGDGVAGTTEDTGGLAAGAGACEDRGVEGGGVSLHHVGHDESVHGGAVLVDEVVGHALENLEALRGQGHLRVGGLRLGGGDILGDPGGIGAAGHDVQVAGQVVDEVDTQAGGEHLATQLPLIGEELLLLEGVTIAALGGVGVVIGTEGEGRDVHGVGGGVDTAALELGLTFLGHLGLDAGQVVVLRLAQELGDGELADLFLLLRGEDALVGEGLAGGLFDLGVAELTGEGGGFVGQGLALRDILAGFELTHLGVELGGNLDRVSHG